MEEVGKSDESEKINRVALRIAREIATESGTLMAGGVCRTQLYVPGDKQIEAEIRAIYTEQVGQIAIQ